MATYKCKNEARAGDRVICEDPMGPYLRAGLQDEVTDAGDGMVRLSRMGLWFLAERFRLLARKNKTVPADPPAAGRPEAATEGTPDCCGPVCGCGPVISLRDYAAIHVDQPGRVEIMSAAGLTIKDAYSFTVTSEGDGSSLTVQFDDWWNGLPQAERFRLYWKVRYGMADAMLAARDTGS